MNIVDENGDRLADGTAPDNSDQTMENVNVHSGVFDIKIKELKIFNFDDA